MKMRKGLAVIAVLSLCLAVGAQFLFNRGGLSFVQDMDMDASGRVALIDAAERGSSLVQLSAAGRVLARTKLPQRVGDLSIRSSAVLALPDGGAVVQSSILNFDTLLVENEILVRYDGRGANPRLLANIDYRALGRAEYDENMTGLHLSGDAMGFYLIEGGYVRRYSVPLESNTPFNPADLQDKSSSLAVREEVYVPGDALVTSYTYTRAGTAVLCANGWLYLSSGGHAARIYPVQAQSAPTVVTYVVADGEGRLVLADYAGNALLRYDEATGAFTQLYELGRTFGADGLLYDMKAISMVNEDFFAGLMTSGHGSDVVLVSGDTSALLRADTPAGRMALGAALVFLALFFVLGFSLELVAWLRGRRRVVPLAAKQAFVILPLTVLGAVLLFVLMRSSLDGLIARQYHQYLYARGSVVAERFSQKWDSLSAALATNNPYEDGDFWALTQDGLDEATYTDLAAEAGGRNLVLHDLVYFWVFSIKEGVPVALSCDGNGLGLPISYLYDEHVRANFAAVYSGEQSRVQLCRIRDTAGEWLLTLIPIKNAAGETVGIVEAGSNSHLYRDQVDAASRTLALLCGAIMGAVILWYLAVLVFSLRPLRRLKVAVQAISDGRTGAQVSITSNDEIGEISRVFNSMSSYIQGQLHDLHRLNASYQRFVPFKLMELLSQTGVADVRLGDQTLRSATVMAMSVRGFDRIATSLTTDELFRFLNEVYETFVPLLTRYTGVVDRYTEAGWMALFTGSFDDARSAAIDMRARLTEYNLAREARGDGPVDIGLALAHGRVMIGIVGNRDRVAVSAISEVVNLTQNMLEIGDKLGVSILCTGPGGEGESGSLGRRIGQIALSGQRVDLYDCFDADSDVQRMLKRITHEPFEQGVSAYIRREFYQARKSFIEVLRKNPADVSAQVYLKRCDERYHDEQGSDTTLMSLS